MHKPRLAALALATAASITLAGCASGSQPDGAAPAGQLTELAADQQVEITFESYNFASAGIWGDSIMKLIEEFEDEHPNITVNTQAIESTSTGASVQQQVLAGDPPDVAQLTFNELDFAATELGAQNLTELVGQAELDAHFGGEYPVHERARVLADWDGETYGLPYVFSTPLLWINETMFEEAGLDPATVDLSTWDAVAEAAATISEHTGAPSISLTCVVTGGSWCMQGLFRSNGAQVLSDDRTTIGFGSDEAIETVQVFRDMFDDGIMTSEDTNTQYETFIGGTTAINVNTSALQGAFMAGAESGGWTLGNRTLPAFGDQPVVPTNSGSMLQMFASTPETQAASWLLMQHLTSSRAYEIISTEIGYLPLRTTMTEEGGPLYEWVQENPLVQPNLDQLDALEPWVSYPGNSYLQIDGILADAIEEAIFYGADPATVMTEAAERAQGML